MSFAIYIIFALLINQINKLPITQGKFGLKITFWGFGVAGSALLYSVGAWYFMGALDSMELEYQLNSSLSTALSILPIYSYIVLRGIWNASKNAGVLVKLAARYFSLFFLFAIIGCVAFLTFQYVVALVIMLAVKCQKPKKTFVS